MQNRRKFLKNAASLAAIAPALSAENCFVPVPRHIGVQLWSVRDDMAKDAKGTIEAIAKMGYREVEPFGFDTGKLHGYTYDDFVKLLKDNNLTMPSTHCMIKLENYNEAAKDITDATKKIIDDAAKHGLSYLICPWMNENERPMVDKLVKVYDACGRYAKKAGIRLAYHNHDFEFKQKASDGRLIQEWLLHEVDSANMALQMDIYWVYFANHNPLDWIKLYPGRWELCHAKDIARTEKRESIEVGDGDGDFKSIFRQASKAGMKHFVVELESYVTTPLKGIERARKNLLTMF
jgi:sugar phosphate isomerase/epimerase